MNERIKELEMQVARSFDPLKDWDCSEQEYAAEFNRRFAELIVRECVSVINTEAAEHEDDGEIVRAWKMGTEFAVYQIKQHFGVEE